MNELTIYVTRHGKTLLNTLNLMQGWCDSLLTTAGIEIAQQLGRGLKDIKFDAAYCSDLRRTLQTAQIVLKAKGQENTDITEIEGLREAYFGGLEASCNDKIWDKVSLYLKYLNTDDMDADLEKGVISYADLQNTIAKLDPMHLAETWQQIEYRTQKALTQIAEAEAKKGSSDILVVAHAQCIAAMLLSWGGDKLIDGDLQNASVCKVSYVDGKFTVKSMGDMSYVEKGL